MCSSACWKIRKDHLHGFFNIHVGLLCAFYLSFFSPIIQHRSWIPCCSKKLSNLVFWSSLEHTNQEEFSKRSLCFCFTKKMELHVHCDRLLVCFHNLLTSTWNSGCNWKVGNWFKCFGEWLAVMLSMILTNNIHGDLLWVFIVEKTETTVRHIKD